MPLGETEMEEGRREKEKKGRWRRKGGGNRERRNEEGREREEGWESIMRSKDRGIY